MSLVKNFNDIRDNLSKEQDIETSVYYLLRTFLFLIKKYTYKKEIGISASFTRKVRLIYYFSMK